MWFFFHKSGFQKSNSGSAGVFIRKPYLYFPLVPLSGDCNGRGQGAVDNGPSEKTDDSGKTVAGESDPR